MKDKIIQCLEENRLLSSKEIHEKLSENIAYATLKRTLSKLIEEKLIVSEGKGKATKYKISTTYQLFYPINLDTYFEKDRVNARNFLYCFSKLEINFYFQSFSKIQSKKTISIYSK